MFSCRAAADLWLRSRAQPWRVPAALGRGPGLRAARTRLSPPCGKGKKISRSLDLRLFGSLSHKRGGQRQLRGLLRLHKPPTLTTQDGEPAPLSHASITPSVCIPDTQLRGNVGQPPQRPPTPPEGGHGGRGLGGQLAPVPAHVSGCSPPPPPPPLRVQGAPLHRRELLGRHVALACEPCSIFSPSSLPARRPRCRAMCGRPPDRTWGCRSAEGLRDPCARLDTRGRAWPALRTSTDTRVHDHG
ncbi:uncharacterized protein LOC127394233 [Apus apus]|uniref:uncharacterized protein LOC127394233 n=1 Tax=Apus apus TaxID=8895 RepID=UPI0021F8F952|nr:uncharacterized protein LOC127394233 [Apus apus]